MRYRGDAGRKGTYRIDWTKRAFWHPRSLYPVQKIISLSSSQVKQICYREISMSFHRATVNLSQRRCSVGESS